MLPDGAFDLVIRPEEVEVRLPGAPASGLAAGTVTPATVTRLVLQGGHVLVGAETPEPLDALVTRRRAEELDLRVGAAVELVIDAGHIHVIPAS